MSQQEEAAIFWDYYFRNRFATLERSASGYKGMARGDAGVPAGLVREPERRLIAVSMDALRAHNYEADQRFSLILLRPTTVAEALDAVAAGTYPYREPAPFGKERMAELARLLRSQLQGTSATLAGAQQALAHMIDGYTPAASQPMTALVWLLGELRDRSSGPVLCEVLRNSSYAAFAKHRLHFTVVDAAFSALWKVDDKASAYSVLDLMRNSSESGQYKMAALMERLFSTTVLLSIEHCGEEYPNPDFWAKSLQPLRAQSADEWARWDAQSLFWEIRLLSALRVPASDTETLRRLSNDEVGTVRKAASQRLTKRA